MSVQPIPKKSLGQHWLYDESTLDSICDSADIKSGDVVLEVGPGLGTLTKKLLERGAVVTAVEFDHDLAINLEWNINNIEDGPYDKSVLQNLTVIEEDILKFDLRQMPSGYKVVANIPYYLTSNLIRLLSESPNRFSTAVLLIQSEVAERANAQPGQMSLLSVSAQYYCEVSLGVFVPAQLFTPPPKVDSRVLVLRRRQNPMFGEIDEKAFFRLIKAGFSQKRKTLINALSGGLGISKDAARGLTELAGLDLMVRAQALSLDDWFNLYKTWQK